MTSYTMPNQADNHVLSKQNNPTLPVGFFLANDKFADFESNLLYTLFGDILASLTDGVFILDDAFHYIGFNQNFLILTGLKHEQLMGRNFSFYLIEHLPPFFLAQFTEIYQRLKTAQPIEMCLKIPRSGKEETFINLHIQPALLTNNKRVFIGFLTNLSKNFQYFQGFMDNLAYDKLTGLQSRESFYQSVTLAIQGIAELCRPNIGLYILRINIDKLHLFNNTLGVEKTDRLLQQFVKRLREISVDKVGLKGFSRFGGGDFALFIRTDDIAHAYHYLDKLSQLLEVPFVIDKQYLYVRASVGVAQYPKDSGTADSLIAQAEIGLDHAQTRGGDSIVWYHNLCHHQNLPNEHLLSAFGQAIKDAQIVPFFQPKVMFAQPDMPMFEALVRWQHPVRGMLTPQVFLDEVMHGMSHQLFETILQASLEQIIAWQRQGFYAKVCINIDARQFNDDRFLAFILELIEKYPSFIHYIEFELTEIARLVDKPKAVKALQGLREQGIFLAIDDFGTGYASFSYLVDFPIDLLKIDRSFIHQIPCQDNKQKIVEKMIELAHALDIKVIAEGVETAAERDFLAGIGCDGIQGYLISPPMSAPDTTQWLITHFIPDLAMANDFEAQYPLPTPTP